MNPASPGMPPPAPAPRADAHDFGAQQISWQVELRVKPGQLDALRALTNEMLESTKGEAGTLIYERFVSIDGHVVHVIERYADSTAAVAHLQTFGRLYGERFSNLVDRNRFAVFGSPSLELRSILDRFGATYFAPFGGFSRLQPCRPDE